jgi:hypothetical protein
LSIRVLGLINMRLILEDNKLMVNTMEHYGVDKHGRV